ncbi:MAG: HAD family hydrolase [Marinagarivorans sp.]|nr:HAD family hydrolase [Marinagarivorans sp.]
MSVSLEDYQQQGLQQADIKVAFFDIDGTLLGLDGNYTERLQKSILRVQSLGVKTAIASGRPYFATRFLWEGLGLTDAGVFCTGAQIYEPKLNITHQAIYLPESKVKQLLEVLRGSGIYYELYTDEGFYVEDNNTPELLALHASHLRATPHFKRFDGLTGGAIKLLLGANIAQDAEILKRIERQFPDVIFAYACLPAYPEWQFASVIDGAACKQKAFDFLLGFYGVSASNVISFGDAQSDKTFLSLAGVGVAMGNASDEVKAIANIQTLPVWQDGVAHVLDALIK